MKLLDCSDRGSQRSHIDPTRAVGCRRRGARLGVDQLAGDDGYSTIPQLGRDIRSWFVEDELD